MEKFLSLEDMEEVARENTTRNAWEFFSGGIERNATVEENKEAFKRIKLIPRALVDMTHMDLRTTLLGETVDLPIGISPSSNQKLAHADGEHANAKGAGKMNACFILSSHTNTPMLDVARATTSLKWLNIYIFRDLDSVRKIVGLAEERGFKAIVVTVDTPMLPSGRKPIKLYLPPGVKSEFLIEIGMDLDPVPAPGHELVSNIPGTTCFDETRTWKDLAWLKSITKLPIIAKGIMNPGDAVLAWKHGASAIIVSNHGGRNIDTVPATIDVLPDIVAAVGDKMEVYIDGGIRHGSDVFKALALGARAAFVGRPAVWGLACGGEHGVARMLEILKERLKHTMAFTGCRTISEISEAAIYKGDKSKI